MYQSTFNTKILSRVFVTALLTGLLASGPAQATLLSSEVGYTGPALDLTAYVGLGYNFTFGPKPIPGGITFTSNVISSNSGLGSVLGQGGYGLGGNGTFGLPAVYAGLDGTLGYMTFSFAAPVSSFGAYMNYVPGNPTFPTISAYDSLDVLIESWSLPVSAPISTPGGFNAFAFRGIDVGSPIMSSFRMEGNYVLAAATKSGDPKPTVPEPASLLLLGSGVIGLGIWARRRAS